MHRLAICILGALSTLCAYAQSDTTENRHWTYSSSLIKVGYQFGPMHSWEFGAGIHKDWARNSGRPYWHEDHQMVSITTSWLPTTHGYRIAAYYFTTLNESLRAKHAFASASWGPIAGIEATHYDRPEGAQDMTSICIGLSDFGRVNLLYQYALPFGSDLPADQRHAVALHMIITLKDLMHC